jgi:large subunit ribosomal protein L35
MPKMKTDKGAKKRFKVTGTGKLMRRNSMRSHLLEKKAPSRKRRLAKESQLSPGDTRQVKRLLGL